MRVRNIGNKTANNVVLTINLPVTNTSPTVYVLGTVGSFDGRCTRAGRVLTCPLGNVARNGSTLVPFNIALPRSSAPIVFTTSVTTTSAENSSTNNGASLTPTITYPDLAVAAGSLAINEHCTGTNLTSFFECELFPSSISEHSTVFQAAGALTFVDAPPEYTGTWSQPAANRLVFSYFENGTLVAAFSGYSVDTDCFEGITTFPGSPYVAPYSVCLQ